MQILQKSVYLFKIVAIITIYTYKTNIYERVSRYKFKKKNKRQKNNVKEKFVSKNL